jgi:ParB family transcriptional regulator, chromosome partitioning protein
MPGLPVGSGEDLRKRRQERHAHRLIEEAQAAGPDTVVAIDALVAHPDNPRSDIGGLDDIVQSIKSMGLLQPLVVTTREAHLAAHPDHAAAIGAAQYVIIAGHRRHAAAALANVEQIPVSVRPELSEAGRDIEAMVVENARRQDLSPLDEAGAFQQLVDRGHSQRQIAEAVGCSQPHVNKRLALLRLPGDIQQALRTERLTVADALTLGKLDDQADQLAAWQLAAAGTGLGVADAVAEQRRRSATAKRTEQSRRRATQEGVELLDPVQLWGSAGAAKRRLTDQGAIAQARAAGSLAAAIDTSGELYYLTLNEPDDHASSEDGQEEDKARKAASRARAMACAQIARRRPSSADALRRLATCIISRDADNDALRLAHRWLTEAGIGPATDRHDQYAEALLAGEPELAVQFAHAAALAGEELRTRRAQTWDARAAAHVRRLMADAEYIPTAWEEDRLAEAETGRIQPLTTPA